MQARPCRDAIEVAELVLEAGQDREYRRPSRRLPLLGRDLGADAPERPGRGALGIDRHMPGDQHSLAPHSDQARRHRAQRTTIAQRTRKSPKN